MRIQVSKISVYKLIFEFYQDVINIIEVQIDEFRIVDLLNCHFKVI